MFLSYPIDIADGESIVIARILPDSSYYTDKMLSVIHSHRTNYDRFLHRQSTKSGMLNLYKFSDTAKPPNSGFLRPFISPC